MKKTLRAIRFFWWVIICGIHEMCHVLMILLLSPFKVRVHDYKISVGELDGKPHYNMHVTHKMANDKNRPVLWLLVAMAPTIIWAVALIVSVCLRSYFTIGFLLLSCKWMTHSKGDLTHAKEALQKLVSRDIPK